MGSIQANIQHLATIFGQLSELRGEEESDEFGVLRPTDFAFQAAGGLLLEAAVAAARDGREIPHGCVSTDSEGGIRIEWVRPRSSVHLVIPASPDREAYLYHEVENNYASEPVTVTTLAHWLRVID
jgi:hypothetical protein